MASHPYISGAGNITQMIGFLRKNFPATITSDTVKRLGLASKNESYVINVLQFLGLIDVEGKRTNEGHEVLTRHDETEFQAAFAALVKKAYADLFELRADDAWTMTKDQLIGYFRSSDKTSEAIGGRQAAVFMALRELAGYRTDETVNQRPRAANPGKPAATKKAKPAPAPYRVANERAEEIAGPLAHSSGPPKSDVALTVRIEINLPTEGSQETYDAIFKSIKANLFP
ncbi:DUF5343 domain-containing protein [Mesorhizobium sp. M1273]|uniref:DUF5343 domain-containing protein n=1 Tax=Mesorhizobium sp. M1273 TaxID=2957075 RepID=UPI00333905C7